MRLIRITESDDILNTESWRKACTYKKVSNSMIELRRVLDILKRSTIADDRTYDFFSYYPDKMGRKLGVKLIDQEKVVSNDVADASITLIDAERCLRHGEVFDTNYTVPKRSSFDPLTDATRDEPNGRYLRRITNFEEYVILLHYATSLAGDISVVRGITYEFNNLMNSVTKLLEHAMELVDDFVENSDEYRQELKSKNR